MAPSLLLPNPEDMAALAVDSAVDSAAGLVEAEVMVVAEVWEAWVAAEVEADGQTFLPFKLWRKKKTQNESRQALSLKKPLTSSRGHGVVVS